MVNLMETHSLIEGKRVLLIITGGIAAYKCLDLIRRLRERGCAVRCILTKGGENFVTPLSLETISGDKVYRDMFSATQESRIGHITLARETDLVVVAPATANILAKLAMGIADDLTTTAVLATDKPILVAPAMNVRMWENDATQTNLRILRNRGVRSVGPEEGADGLQRIRIRPHVRTGGNPDGDRGSADHRRHAGRQDRPGHQRPDFRAHRSGALHRQPLVRQTGPRHRRGAVAHGRADHARHRPDP